MHKCTCKLALWALGPGTALQPALPRSCQQKDVLGFKPLPDPRGKCFPVASWWSCTPWFVIHTSHGKLAHVLLFSHLWEMPLAVRFINLGALVVTSLKNFSQRNGHFPPGSDELYFPWKEGSSLALRKPRCLAKAFHRNHSMAIPTTHEEAEEPPPPSFQIGKVRPRRWSDSRKHVSTLPEFSQTQMLRRHPEVTFC